MRNKDIEKSVYEHFNERKPEVFDKIMAHIPDLTVQKKPSFFQQMKKVLLSKPFSYSIAATSMIILLTFILIGQFAPSISDPVTLIALDVNPSLVLQLDENDKVINVVLNNDDAAVIVGDMDLVGADYNVAINALIGSMVTNGYLSELANSVLLSIQSVDTTREDQLMTELTQAINTLLTGFQINGSVITQHLKDDVDAEDLAQTLNISEAKAELILDIIEIDPRMTVEALALISINDLNLLLEAKNINLENVDRTGDASDLSIITQDEAYQLAIAALNIDALTVTSKSVDLEQEDGVMVYEMKIKTSTNEYYVVIDAKNGTVYVNEDETEENNEQVIPDGVLTEQEIIDVIALAYNLSMSLIDELEFDYDTKNNVSYYEVHFKYEGNEYEFEVDATTGYIYSHTIEYEDIDD